MLSDDTINVRYMVDDVAEAVDFYTAHLGFTVRTNALPAFADVTRGNLRLLLSGPASSAGRPMADGYPSRAGRLEPDPLHHRRPRRRRRPAPKRRRPLPQRHRDRTGRLADPRPGPRRQPHRAVPARDPVLRL